MQIRNKTFLRKLKLLPIRSGIVLLSLSSCLVSDMTYIYYVVLPIRLVETVIFTRLALNIRSSSNFSKFNKLKN